MDKIARNLIGVLLVLTALSACTANQKAVVVERRVITQAEIDDKGIGGQFIRIVQPGDTLYSIAFIMNLDVNRIALWNGIEDTEKLLVGQRIRLTEPLGFKYPIKSKLSHRVSTGRRSVVKRAASSSTVTKTKPKPVIAKNKSRADTEALPRQPVEAEARTQEKYLANESVRHRQEHALTVWYWPLRGTLVERFNPAKGQQGIRIQGERGQDVWVSADGEVVYSGDSLRGYGNLIIVKHSEQYLSAYAHNDTILVSEGDMVKQGQTIAKLGGNLIVAPVAQFQIRRNGVPVDPLQHLE
ncbi:MAG: peptidoglycan DD-metalloendopeptidase family protein [Gammaproteobacteria bacterium]|nr:peptidoglycan DD-metalloendopeptidase family protein [Gammaproteobacteria bacterium]